MNGDDKSPEAFRTIGELSRELGVAQHILRYWEGRFTQLRPLQRAGNRRYYRPADVALVRRIHRLLTDEGYTIRGVQQLLSARSGARSTAEPNADVAASCNPADQPTEQQRQAAIPVERLRALRDRLTEALD